MMLVMNASYNHCEQLRLLDKQKQRETLDFKEGFKRELSVHDVRGYIISGIQLLTKLLIFFMCPLPSCHLFPALGVIYEVWPPAHFPGGTDPG